ncbi:MAG: hypothetical protein FWJ83_08740, partial [Limnochordales bacterium]
MVNDIIFPLVTPKVRAGASQPAPAAYIHGFAAGHKTLAIAAWHARGWPQPGRRTTLVLTVGPGHAQRLAQQLSSLLPDEDVLVFPAREVWPHEELHVPEAIASARLAVLERLVTGEPALVIAPIQAAAERLAPRAALRERVRTVAVGHILPMEQLAEALVRDGYERAAMVEGRGQFSVRGGLLDVFPPSAPAPYRIDFFDDEIDSIRVFDPETQRSVEDVERVRIGPAREVPPVDDEAVVSRSEGGTTSLLPDEEGPAAEAEPALSAQPGRTAQPISIFPDLDAATPGPPPRRGAARTAPYVYPLRTDLPFPRQLRRAQVALKPQADLLSDIVNLMKVDDEVLVLSRRDSATVLMERMELFGRRREAPEE